MNVREAQARVKARVWQTIAQSEGEFKTIPQPTLDALIDLITNAALLELDEELDEVVQTSKQKTEAPATSGEERILWEGRPFLSIGLTYVITNERVRIMEGIMGKSRNDIELIRIQDIDQSQTLRERLVNVGDIIIHSHDPNHPWVKLNNVRDPQAVHEILRRAVLEAREKHRLVYREEM